MDSTSLKKPVDLQGLSLALAKTKADYEAQIANRATQSDWENDNTNDTAHILNRPAIRAGEGENSIVEGLVDPPDDAGIYTIYVTNSAGTSETNTFTYTTNDTLPSSATNIKNYGVWCDEATSPLTWSGIRDVDTTNHTIQIDKTYYSATSISGREIKIYYKYQLAVAKYSHAEGQHNLASGYYSHAEGSQTRASGDSAHSEGNKTKALGGYSHAEGQGTIASSIRQHVQGKYNIEDSSGTYAHIVGNGTGTTPSNAHTLDWSGNAWYAGKVSAGTVETPATPTAANDLTTKAYVDSATAGITTNLAGLTDTTITTPTDGQVLTYDSTTSKWVNEDATGVTYSLSISNNVITLTGSNGSTSSVTLPVYNGAVTDVWEGGTY